MSRIRFDELMQKTRISVGQFIHSTKVLLNAFNRKSRNPINLSLPRIQIIANQLVRLVR